MTTDHRAEAARHAEMAARHLTEHPSDMRIAEVAAWTSTAHALLAQNQRLVLLDSLQNTGIEAHPDLPGEKRQGRGWRQVAVNPANVAMVRPASDHDGQPTSWLSWPGQDDEVRVRGSVLEVTALLNGGAR